MGSRTNLQAGFTLVEALLSISILMLLAVGSISANRLATASVTINQLRSKANTLSVEGMEALMSIRAENFLNLSLGVFHPVFDGSKWTLVSGAENLNGFTRSVTISPVMRSLVCFAAVCDIVAQGGIVDSGSLKAEVKVSWLQSGASKEVVLSSLITYWR